jgi:hypothetical protein
MSRSFLLIFVTFVACALTACANTVHRSVVTGNENSALTAQPFMPDGLNESAADAAAFNCPDQPNVVPDYDWNFNGTGSFTVCPSNSNLSDVLVSGTSVVAGPVCIFPAQITSSGTVVAEQNPNNANGTPWVQCVTPGDDGVHASFPGINWNAAFIVDAQDVTQMSLCIQGGIYSYCPKNYSFGSFR